MQIEKTMKKTGAGNTERIRGPGLKILVKKAEGVAYREALELADKNNLVLASNKRLSRPLTLTTEYKDLRKIREALPCWTGTMAGYVEPDTAFCESKYYSREDGAILYKDPKDGQVYAFPVPVKYRDKENMVLLAEHPDFSLVQDGKNLVVDASIIAGLAQFPKKSYWYDNDEHGQNGDGQFDIPVGERVGNWEKNVRYLVRKIDSRVGPVARPIFCGFGLYINLNDQPSDRFGVVVEAESEGGA